jgi:flagellar assembly factor FliW
MSAVATSPVRPDDLTGTELTIEFVTDMPGLPGMSRCGLVRLDESGALYRLQSLIDPDLRLLVAAPPVFFSDYEPQIDDETAASIGLSAVEDAVVLVVVTAGASAAQATANLLAPIVINATTRQAVQVLQVNQQLSAPLVG